MDDRAVMSHLRDDDNIKSWVCQFCGEPFPYDVHPEVIRHHLTWKCENAPEDVKEAAQRMEEDEFSVSVKGNNNNFNANTEDSRYAGREVEAGECSRSVNWELTRIQSMSEQESVEVEVEAEVSSVQCSNKRQIECNMIQSSHKRQRSTPDAVPVVAAPEVPVAVQETGGSASLTKKAVGGTFKRNEEKKWSWLMQVLRVGSYCMEGVGKATLMRYIEQYFLSGQVTGNQTGSERVSATADVVTDEGDWNEVQSDAVPAALIFLKLQGIQCVEVFPFSKYSTDYNSMSNLPFLNLMQICIWECPYMKKLFPPNLLPNLRMLSVKNCYGMEEIFSTNQEEEDGQELSFDQPNLTALHLRLTTLTLRCLPELDAYTRAQSSVILYKNLNCLNARN